VSEAIDFEVRGVVVGLFRENCWIIGSRQRGEACVVDPGDEPHEILALARDMGVKITRIVASHAHLDHIMAARAIVEANGAPFMMHMDDAWIADQLPQTAKQLIGADVEPPPPIDAPLRHDDDLEVAGLSLRVVHVPGHTPGSVALHVPEAGLLFSGDTLFRGSIGRTDLPGGNGPQIMRSILDNLLTLPDETRVLPGHMQETTIGAERATNPFVLEALRRRGGR
jgi:glyoxylase-like metal-dependent hydrolase (beta-lactamase superfamily II)